jgi:glycosyltransferase involved in cell wall biosynthesis
MTEPMINILLATYQGEAYLNAQLESIKAQTYRHWRLYISDDGSNDGTLEIIKNFSLSVSSTITVLSGPGKGATYNFLYLLNQISTDPSEDLYAFCDQDDIWLPDKLTAAFQHYRTQNLKTKQPYLYCGATRIVDVNLEFKRLSSKPSRPPSFGNALVQNIASGNTMVFNNALLNLIKIIKAEDVVIHDWLAYQVATGCDGVVFYDETAYLLYRQHSNNAIGANSGLKASFKRLQALVDGKTIVWADQTQAAINSINSHLKLSAMEQFQDFKEIRSEKKTLIRVNRYLKSTLIRQTLLGRISLAIAFIFRLI